MKVLNFEDNPIKHKAIKDVLESCRVTEIDCAMYMDEGLNMYREALETDKPYDLIITDMWYPPARGEDEARSGERLIGLACEEKWSVPVIVCSNQNYDYPEIYGSLYYSENEDWEGKLRNYISRLKKK